VLSIRCCPLPLHGKKKRRGKDDSFSCTALHETGFQHNFTANLLSMLREAHYDDCSRARVRVVFFGCIVRLGADFDEEIDLGVLAR
jgi:hypothetical protein